jgi:hypothetical protein
MASIESLECGVPNFDEIKEVSESLTNEPVLFYIFAHSEFVNSNKTGRQATVHKSLYSSIKRK